MYWLSCQDARNDSSDGEYPQEISGDEPPDRLVASFYDDGIFDVFRSIGQEGVYASLEQLGEYGGE